jgi:hypothetical protein
MGMKVGVAIKPDTPADVLYPILDGEGEKPDVCYPHPHISINKLTHTTDGPSNDR